MTRKGPLSANRYGAHLARASANATTPVQDQAKTTALVFMFSRNGGGS
jgi:hypothetical protein